MEIQIQELEGDGGGEHPLRAQSWSEPSWNKAMKLCGERFRCDGCRFGCQSPKTGRPILKSWGWFSSHAGVRQALEKKCQHEKGEHDVIEGDITSGTAVYPRLLRVAFAHALLGIKHQVETICKRTNQIARSTPVFVNEVKESSDGKSQDHVPLAEDLDSTKEHLESGTNPPVAVDADLDWGPGQIRKRLRLIHSNLGHPSKSVLMRLLKEAKAS